MKPTPVRRILWVIAILVLLGLLMAGLARAQPVHIRDDRGREVSLPRPPQRIVSLLPSLTESVCELEQCHRLVGVDRYSNWPEAVIAKLPKVGGGLDPSIEAVVALKPDVVLMSVSSRASDRLEALGLTVVQLEPKTHADVRRVLGTVSDLLGV
ncbi:ABC transporter substrate-binding protein, partial [Acidovorax sp. HMWF018]